MLRQIINMMGKTASVVYTTLNPSDKGANVTLSGGNLTAANSGVGCVRTVKAIAAGEHKYWEVTVGTNTASQSIGAANGTLNTGSYAGVDANGIGYLPGGVLCNNTLQFAAATYTTGDVLGFELDLTTPGAYALKVYKNNALQGTVSNAVVTAVGAPFYPCPGAAGGTNSATSNFGPTMTYGIPSGASLITA